MLTSSVKSNTLVSSYSDNHAHRPNIAPSFHFRGYLLIPTFEDVLSHQASIAHAATDQTLVITSAIIKFCRNHSAPNCSFPFIPIELKSNANHVDCDLPLSATFLP